MTKDKKLSIIFSILAVVILVGIDQLTKYIANNNETLLSGEKIIFIKHILSFKLSYNKGAAWSILEGCKFALVTISVIASVGVMLLLVKFANFKQSILFTISLILIDGGAIGNLIDRAFYEKGVIDFLNFEFMDFPIFNFADSCLTVGAILLMVYVIFFYKDPIKPKNKIEETQTIEGVKEDAQN